MNIYCKSMWPLMLPFRDKFRNAQLHLDKCHSPIFTIKSVHFHVYHPRKGLFTKIHCSKRYEYLRDIFSKKNYFYKCWRVTVEPGSAEVQSFHQGIHHWHVLTSIEHLRMTHWTQIKNHWSNVLFCKRSLLCWHNILFKFLEVSLMYSLWQLLQ